MPDNAEDIYKRLLESTGGDYGEAFNQTEMARQGRPPQMMQGLDPATTVEVNRMAQSADTPATALLAAPYEALKMGEQKTGIPMLSGPAKAMSRMGVPVAAPTGNTSPARLGNILASIRGAGFRGSKLLEALFKGARSA